MTRLIECAEQALLSYYDATLEIGATGWRISPRDGYVIVGGRGTANWQDVVFDIKGVLVARAGEGQMEDGFADASDPCIQPLAAALADYKDGVPIYFGLHSFACPVGRRMARKLHDLGFRIAGVLCLESPRTGDSAWEAWYAAAGIPTLYVRHGADGVCTVPPLALGFAEVGTPDQTVILDNNGHVMTKQPFPPGWEFVTDCKDTCRDHAAASVIRAFRYYQEKKGNT